MAAGSKFAQYATRMTRTHNRPPRLWVEPSLAEGAEVRLDPEQLNYLVNVLRLGDGARTLAFNGRDGEFSALLAIGSRKSATLRVVARTRAQEAPPDVELLFAPIKHARLDYLAQKAVEMGAGRLRPVLTRRTQAARVNVDRLRANAIEACEQCGVTWVPEIGEAETLDEALARWPAERLLVFCDEEAPVESALSVLAQAKGGHGVGLLIGPEGGFDDEERAAILLKPRVLRLSLGPRILRADTAAVAAMALVQATLGDWRAR
jgi:16S rRNA (uracil1498-N3)-methyltransferase